MRCKVISAMKMRRETDLPFETINQSIKLRLRCEEKGWTVSIAPLQHARSATKNKTRSFLLPYLE